MKEHVLEELEELEEHLVSVYALNKIIFPQCNQTHVTKSLFLFASEIERNFCKQKSMGLRAQETSS